MSTNSDLKSFAVFVNSKSAITPSTEKAKVSIPFVANLAYHDPMRVFKFSMVDMLFTNAFFNVREGFNVLKILIKWAAARGKSASEQIVRVQVPNGFYDYDALSDYLNTIISNQSNVILNYPLDNSGIDIYAGFGSLDPGVDTQLQVPIDPTFPNTLTSRIVFQSVSLGMYTQPFTDINTTPTNSASLAYSYVYEGIFLVVDAETAGFMKTLGFYNETIDVPTIKNSTYVGYGFYLEAYTNFASGNPNVNTVFYNLRTQDGTLVQTSGQSDTTITTLVPRSITDLSGLDELYVNCPQLRTQFMSSLRRQKLAPSEVIAVIPVNAPYGSKMSWVPQFPLTSTLINTNITQLDFTITNSNGVPLDFQGINWSMTLYCTEEEDSSKYQFEDTGTLATPFQAQANQLDAGSYMQERRSRKRANFSL